METRPFGQTGESFPILSFGGQRIVDEHNCTEDEAIEIVNTAIDRGIRYFDTAWIYSHGQAEIRLGKVVKHRRKEMWIATKTYATSYDGARKQLEESLNRLQTDHVDEWRLHNIIDYSRLNDFTSKEGALQAAIKARDEGMIRNISISCHTNPQLLVEALNRFPFDSALIALSALDHFVLSFAEEFLPVANQKGVATIGMKVLGLGSLTHEVERSLRILDTENPSVTGFFRFSEDQEALVIVNLSSEMQRIPTPWGLDGYETSFSNFNVFKINNKEITLQPYAIFVLTKETVAIK